MKDTFLWVRRFANIRVLEQTMQQIAAEEFADLALKIVFDLPPKRFTVSLLCGADCSHQRPCV